MNFAIAAAFEKFMHRFVWRVAFENENFPFFSVLAVYFLEGGSGVGEGVQFVDFFDALEFGVCRRNLGSPDVPVLAVLLTVQKRDNLFILGRQTVLLALKFGVKILDLDTFLTALVDFFQTLAGTIRQTQAS